MQIVPQFFFGSSSNSIAYCTGIIVIFSLIQIQITYKAFYDASRNFKILQIEIMTFVVKLFTLVVVRNLWNLEITSQNGKNIFWNSNFWRETVNVQGFFVRKKTKNKFQNFKKNGGKPCTITRHTYNGTMSALRAFYKQSIR
jgi:hypothetical protein